MNTSLYLSHGGGPLPLLGDTAHKEMCEVLEQIAKSLARPKAIVLVSAHWEASPIKIIASSQPPLLYDYYNFPKESYSIQYPAPGQPKLAKKILQLLEQHGINAELEYDRGFDHGMFVPLKIMYPEADIPCVQISLNNDLDATTHLALGQALRDLNDEFLLIGSGFSFHNMKAFFAKVQDEVQQHNQAFDQWLQATCYSTELSESERTQRLIQWEEAPSARFCHPREEHLLPLHVCYGYAQVPSDQVYSLKILNRLASMILWHSKEN